MELEDGVNGLSTLDAHSVSDLHRNKLDKQLPVAIVAVLLLTTKLSGLKDALDKVRRVFDEHVKKSRTKAKTVENHNISE